MSFWEFSVALDGWMRAQGVEQKPDMLDDAMLDEFDRMVGNG
jgi:hypothetical protein